MSRVLMIHFSHYPDDVRIRREAETMLEEGLSVDTICLVDGKQPKQETVFDVDVRRVNIERQRGSKLRYFWEYTWFGLVAFFLTSVKFMRKRYSIVHIHNMPDVLVFCALIPKLFGARILLDLHDPVPEVFMTKYDMSISHPFIRLLIFLEKISIRFADQVITPNIAFRKLFISRGCPPEKIGIVMNTPMERHFTSVASSVSANGKVPSAFNIMYHGTIVERHGLLLALDAIKQLGNDIPGLHFHVYGDGDCVDRFQEKVAALDLEEIVTYYGPVSNQEIAKAITRVNLGIIPNLNSPFTDLNFPVRIFEYLALKKPVIVPRTTGILDYFNEENINFFEAGDTDSLVNAILSVYRQPGRQELLLEAGVKIYDRYRWIEHRRDFIDIVNKILKEPVLSSAAGQRAMDK